MNRQALFTTLATFVAVAGFAAPGLAGPLSLTSDGAANDHFNTEIVLRHLQDQGLEVSELSDWNGVIRATVRLDNGQTTFQYFDINTLQPVSAIGSTLPTTRVLSERDVGPVPALQPSLESLASNNVDDD